jgi:hypothetical protein
VHALSRAALVLIPSHCNCTTTILSLIPVVTGAHAMPYLVYTASTRADVLRVYTSLGSGFRTQVRLAQDTGNMLRGSIPGQLDADGLAAILIGPNKVVTDVTVLGPHDDPTTLIKALTH